MSEPRHVWLHPREVGNDFGTWKDEADGDDAYTVRATITSGEEWDALMERARYEYERYGDDLTGDILTYFGEQP